MLRIILVLAACCWAGHTLSVDGGRYVLGQINDTRADRYLLDTQTGRVWRVVNSEYGETMLEEVVFYKVSGLGDSTQLLKSQTPFSLDTSMRRLIPPPKPEPPKPLKPDTIYKADPGQVSRKAVAFGFLSILAVGGILAVALATQ